MAIATFTVGTKVARERDRGTAPSALTTNWANGSAWNLGGAWFDVITDGMPDLKEQREIIYPQGHAGKRFVNQQQAIVGRKWSDGGFSAPVVADYLGLLLYAALGEASTNLVGSQASLMPGERVQTTPKSFVLANQPTDGGKIISFEIKGTGKAGTIAISGIDTYGNGASETISFASAGVFFAKTAFSSIGASGVQVTIPGLLAAAEASLTIIGIDKFTHTFTPASGSSGITLSIEQHGAPEAGAASKSFIHTGMALTELSLNTPAQANDGVFTVNAAFEGDPTATCNATVLNSPSSLRLWPAWTALVRRDSGTAWNTITDFNMTVATGNKNVMTGTGSQGPQSTLYSGMEVTGDIKFLVDNEIEYNKWVGASTVPLHIRWNTPWKLSSANNYELNASLLVNLTDFSKSDSDGAQEISFGWTGIVSSNFGDVPVKFLLQNGTSSY